MSTWTKLAPIEGFQHCNMCPPRADTMPLEAPLSIGFGEVTVTKNAETVWSGDDSNTRLREFEIKARVDPDHDWRVTIFGPLYTAAYQRHGDGEWVLVERGDGFA